MKIGSARFLGDPIHLPIEIIENIADFVAHLPDEHLRQRSLWSLCLVSRDWYGVSIKYLYSVPVLSTRNFGLFTRTICPPLNTRSRAVGLEDLVTELHMGHLAYTTSSSMTARLLRRTKKSLILFESPSQSMSTSSLAPISKLASLQHLDLSRDKYDFNITMLLRAVRSLTELKFLSLPRFALVEWPEYGEPPLVWPSALEFLQSNYSLGDIPFSWDSLITSLPDSLHTLSFQNLREDDVFNITHESTKARQITTLLIAFHDGEDILGDIETLCAVLASFPRLVNLTLPAAFIEADSYLFQRPEPLGWHLQTLTIGPGFDPDAETDGDRNDFFLRMINKFQDLHYIVVDAAFRNLNRDLLAASDALLAQRWPGIPDDNKGIFVQDGATPRRWDPQRDAEEPAPPPPPTAWFPSTRRTASAS